MGTPDPLVRIEAATLAGCDNNQDRYAYGDGWAFVLDGASSFSEKPPVHDGSWYAERLKAELSHRLTHDPASSTMVLVAESIRETCAAHDSVKQGMCPTSTITIARWNERVVEFYMLGDSCAAVFLERASTPVVLSDNRLSSVGRTLRRQYHEQLTRGSGFGESHRELLKKLQRAELEARNVEAGYWIAGDDPGAARHGLIESFPMSRVRELWLFTDGLTKTQSLESLHADMPIDVALPDLLRRLQERESTDSDGRRHPRAKLHDDKTIVRIRSLV